MVEELNSFSVNASCSVPLVTNHGTVLSVSQTHSTLTDGSDELTQACGFYLPLLLILQAWDRKRLVMKMTLLHTDSRRTPASRMAPTRHHSSRTAHSRYVVNRQGTAFIMWVRKEHFLMYLPWEMM